MSENEGTIVLDSGSSANTMTIDGTHIKLEATTSCTENITDIQNYLDSFNKEIEGNEVTQVQTDGESVEHAYFIDQNVQYINQTNYRRWPDGYGLEGLSEHDAQMMANTNDNNMDNVTQIVLPNVQDKIKKDIPQIVALGDGSGYQTVTLVQS
ncbi:unnamed protein product [Macrosiphum euphorbiae]|uniref:Uncharacterized protein n=1 Tax=Macrosiphum euphorbiae TaxID=13131 RepID=A0AAV0VMN2_9HEMI|nr:unnamed protein product [Macrosiphum euphorbiae]